MNFLRHLSIALLALGSVSIYASDAVKVRDRTTPGGTALEADKDKLARPEIKDDSDDSGSDEDVTSGTSTLTPTGRVTFREITKSLGAQFNTQQFTLDLSTVEIPQEIFEEVESITSIEDQISRKYDILDSMKDNKVRELTALFAKQLEQGKIHAFDIKRAVNNIYVPALERRWKRMEHVYRTQVAELALPISFTFSKLTQR